MGSGPRQGGAVRERGVAVTRGPTRRLRQLMRAGQVSDELLRAAEHEADALEHPYVGIEHLELARLRLAGRITERNRLRAQQPIGIGGTGRWWRPRGPRSARRHHGRAEAAAAREAALGAENDVTEQPG